MSIIGPDFNQSAHEKIILYILNIRHIYTFDVSAFYLFIFIFFIRDIHVLYTIAPFQHVRGADFLSSPNCRLTQPIVLFYI